MKFFKITLNTVGKDNEKVIFIIPPAEEKDENGNPAYDEFFLLNNAEYKSYVKETKAAVVSVSYILYEAEDNIRLNYDELLKNESGFLKIEQNDYLIEVKKGGRKSPIAFYIVLGIIGAAAVGMLIYAVVTKKLNIGGESSSSDVSADTNIVTVVSDGNISDTPEESKVSDISAETDETVTKLPPSSNTVQSTTAAAVHPENTAETTGQTVLYTLTFDKNGGVGTLKSAQLAGGSVVDLPFVNADKTGFTLSGWADAPREPYTFYDNELNRFVMPQSDVTLYAVWTPAQYEVTYHYSLNGSAVTSKERFKYGELIQLKDISGINSGTGKFIGWGLVPNAKTPVQSLTMPDGGIKLYAMYG